MDKIQVLKPKYRTKEILKEIQECLDTSWTGMGGKSIEFEEKWKDYSDLPHAHFLQSATAGLHLAVKIFIAFSFFLYFLRNFPRMCWPFQAHTSHIFYPLIGPVRIEPTTFRL